MNDSDNLIRAFDTTQIKMADQGRRVQRLVMCRIEFGKSVPRDPQNDYIVHGRAQRTVGRFLHEQLLQVRPYLDTSTIVRSRGRLISVCAVPWHGRLAF